MTLLDRQIEFVEALRSVGLPVSLSEDLDAVRAVTALPSLDRADLREALAASLVKRHTHRGSFDAVFDLYFPALLGSGSGGRLPGEDEGEPQDQAPPPGTGDRPAGQDGPEALEAFRAEVADALAGQGDLAALAREAVERFGSMPGRGPGLSGWSAYTTLHRVHAAKLVEKVVAGLAQTPDDEPAVRREVQRRLESFTAAVESDAHRRVAEHKGAAHMVDHTVRPSIEQLSFTSLKRSDLDEMRRQIHPLARRLATRLVREQHARRRGPLDVRRTIRASMQTGGVPITVRHRPKVPGRTDLVVLCDVSGSVAHFASFTLMLVFALREQFTGVRAFTFVDDIHEVTGHFRPGADPVETMTALAASAEHASRFGRTDYGRAFTRFAEQHGDALTQRASLLVLGDARSNYSDLALPVVRQMAYDVKHAWWLNPEHPRSWDTGDSAASAYADVVDMVECRNLRQLEDFVYALA